MGMSGAQAPVIIIGAGIVGVAAAAFLSRAGIRVRVLEAGVPACGATGAADGAVSVASKRPGPLMRLAREGLKLYSDLTRQGVLEGVYRDKPTFLAASGSAEAQVLAVHAQALRNENVGLVWHEGEDMRRRIPVLSANATALLEVQGEGHAAGFRVVDRMIGWGGLLVERNCHVDELAYNSAGTRIEGVRVGADILPASAVIVAAGGGGPQLLGLGHVLRPRKGQQLVTERAPELAAVLPGSVISAEYLLSKGAQTGARSDRGYGVVIDLQANGQFLIGSTREDGLTDTGNDIDAVMHMAAAAAAIVPALSRLRVLRSFAGVRTAISDGLPLLGAMPGCDNLFAATGFEGDGICLGPVVGSLIAQVVQGKTPAADLTPFDPARLLPIGEAA